MVVVSLSYSSSFVASVAVFAAISSFAFISSIFAPSSSFVASPLTSTLPGVSPFLAYVSSIFLLEYVLLSLRWLSSIGDVTLSSFSSI